MMQIRQATVDDAALIARLMEPVHTVHSQAYPDFFKPYAFTPELVADYRARLLDPLITCLIAEVDGEAVGYALAQEIQREENAYTYAKHSIMVDQISINRDQRSKGYGEALMQAVYDLANKLGITQVELGVWAFNERAIAFYERQGFKPRDTRMEVQLG